MTRMKGKLAAVADVHLGNHRRHGGPVELGMNRRCRQGLAAFAAACKRAAALGCSCLVVLGDLFDDDHPPPQLLAAVQQVLLDADRDGLVVVLLPGNHDQRSGAMGDHAMAPLAHQALVLNSAQVLFPDETGADVLLQLLPHNPALPAVAWLDECATKLARPDKLPGVPRVLCVHMGIADDATPPWLQGSAGSARVEQVVAAARVAGATYVLAGDWHDRVLWAGEGEPTVLQLGALVPTGWDNPGLDGYGTLAVLDPAEGQLFVEDVPGPRFVQVRSLAELDALAANLGQSRACQVYVRAVVAPDQLDAAVAYLGELARHCVVDTYEVLPDTAQAQQQARTAATATRNATTLDAALAAYVERAPMPDGVDRATLLARCQQRLRAAAGKDTP